MGDGVYVVEIASTYQSLLIVAMNIERAESLKLEITGVQARDYLKRFEYDFE